MANNRMFLIHRPTGLAVALGKRMGWGWYNPVDSDRLERFYRVLEEEFVHEGGQDNLTIGFEHTHPEYDYKEVRPDGLLILEQVNKLNLDPCPSCPPGSVCRTPACGRLHRQAARDR